ncbi:MAG TPA: asparagine synthase (glutamine-hydrolyzing) [Chloroflexi bacterium]|nr:asparagine synthase (glutamine-hydrolyzing) [Chloroflexota bacterium]
MCGIFGVFSSNQALLNGTSNRLSLHLLDHRGPDDSGIYQDEDIFLGHTRLSILDLSHGQQPMVSDHGRFVIVYNGEIYNYLTLREELLSKRINLATTSDTEVILKLYQHYGVNDTLDMIEGMFAFGIWDKLEKVLFLARDRIGEKPLYYARTGQDFLFSSEIKSILHTGIISDELNVDGFYEYFCRSKISGERTFYKDIYEINPGHYVLVNFNDKTPVKRCYWDIIDNYKLGQENMIVDKSDAIDSIEDCLLESVNSRMLSDVPVGLLTSGGLDSSVAVSMLVKSGYQAMECFCASNQDNDIDESPFARLLVSYLNQQSEAGLAFNVISNDINTIVDAIPFLSYIHDEPLQYISSMQMYALCFSARQRGIKVLISGEGADEIFCGYDRYERTLMSAHNLVSNRTKIEDILYYGGGLNNAELVSQICGIVPTNVDERFCGESYRWLQDNSSLPLLELMMLYDQRYRLQTINQRQDRMGMAASIELRQPFLNYRLVNLANSLHTSLRFDTSRRTRKYMLKQIGEQYVPREIIDRRKIGFPSDLTLWLQGKQSHKIVSHLVDDKDSISRNYLSLDVIKKVLDSHYNSKHNYDVLIRSLFFMEVWNKNRMGFKDI